MLCNHVLEGTRCRGAALGRQTHTMKLQLRHRVAAVPGWARGGALNLGVGIRDSGLLNNQHGKAHYNTGVIGGWGSVRHNLFDITFRCDVDLPVHPSGHESRSRAI